MAQLSLTPANERQKAQVLDLLQRGRPSHEIAEVVGLSTQQVRAIKAHVTMGTYGGGAAEQEVAEAIDTKFGLERDLQRALRANISQIELGLKVVDGGKEKSVASGRIDIVAEDQAGATIVIELKAGVAERDAIAQILSYMGDLSETAPSVRGIIVAGDFAPPAISAARAISKVRLLKYTFKFAFEVVGF